MMKRKSIYLLIIILAGVVITTLLTLTPNQESLKPKQNLQQKKITESRLNIEQVIEQHEADLMNINGVVGLGISECKKELCIKVYLENNTPELKRKIPTQLGKFKVDPEIIGSVEALPQK